MFLYAHGHQIFGDPDAADIVFTSGADVLAVGINVTHQVVLTGTTLGNLCSLIIVTLVFMYKKTYYHYIYMRLSNKYMSSYMCLWSRYPEYSRPVYDFWVAVG